MAGNATHDRNRCCGEEEETSLDVIRAAHRLRSDDGSVDKDDQHTSEHGANDARAKRAARQAPKRGGHIVKGSDPFTGFHCNVRT